MHWIAFTFAALIATQSTNDSLSFGAIRATHGVNGPPRADWKFIPGDALCVSFEISGLKQAAGGRIGFASLMEVDDPKGTTVFRKDLGDVRFKNVLGAARTPHAVQLPLALDSPPGQYTLRVRVRDLNIKAEGEFKQVFEVGKTSFGLARLQITKDFNGTVFQPPIGVVGEVLYINFGVVGFQRENEEGVISAELVVTDSSGRKTTGSPLRFPARGNNEVVPSENSYLHIQFDLPLNRAGKFDVELTAHDHLGSKKSTLKFPVRVLGSSRE